MKIKSFFEFVEIQTKVASIFPFLFGILYAKYLGYNINIINTVIMLCSLLLLDMATTAINNYMDFKKAKNDEYKYNINVLGKHSLSEKLSKAIIFTLLLGSIVLGVFLVYRTDLVVLFLGVFSFVVGVCYTYGPVPISRTPFGEVVSGFVMGFIIVFLSVYIHNTNIINMSVSENLDLTIIIDSLTVIKIFFVSIPFILVISNIMLGNNMRDLDIDRQNQRFLLPYYIGIEKAFLLFKINYTLVYIVVGIGIIFNILPITTFIVFLSILKVIKNVRNYKQVVLVEKSPRGFKYVVMNMMLISVLYVFSLILSIVF